MSEIEVDADLQTYGVGKRDIDSGLSLDVAPTGSSADFDWSSFGGQVVKTVGDVTGTAIKVIAEGNRPPAANPAAISPELLAALKTQSGGVSRRTDFPQVTLDSETIQTSGVSKRTEFPQLTLTLPEQRKSNTALYIGLGVATAATAGIVIAVVASSRRRKRDK